MQHIQREFNETIQYICVSSPNETPTPCPVMNIQIILRKAISKKTRFLRAVAGSYPFFLR